MRQSDPSAEAALRERTAAKAEELLSASGGSRLAENILFFARTLRAAGLPVGPGRMLDAVEAATAVGVDRRDDFYWALHAVFVNRQDQREIFDQAFHVFWRNPKFLDRLRGLMLPTTFDETAREEDRIALQRRVAEALRGNLPDDRGSEKQEEEIEVDATLTWSERETIRQQDFEQMTSEEVARADLDVSEEDWKFYFELVVQEMGWKWDEKLRLLWITDFFAWQPMQNKKHLLDTLHHLALLPETPWVWELAAAVPIELSASLQAAWTAWFFPAPAVATPEPETSTDEIEDFSQITPDAVPLVLRLWVNRRAPRFFVQAVKRLMLSEQKRQIDSAAESQAGNSERRAVEHSEHQASVNVTEVNLN